MTKFDHKGRAKCRTPGCFVMVLNASDYCELHKSKCRKCHKVSVYRPGETICSRCKRTKQDEPHVLGRTA
jgi:uncharacterized OB-fold protein